MQHSSSATSLGARSKPAPALGGGASGGGGPVASVAAPLKVAWRNGDASTSGGGSAGGGLSFVSFSTPLRGAGAGAAPSPALPPLTASDTTPRRRGPRAARSPGAAARTAASVPAFVRHSSDGPTTLSVSASGAAFPAIGGAHSPSRPSTSTSAALFTPSGSGAGGSGGAYLHRPNTVSMGSRTLGSAGFTASPRSVRASAAAGGSTGPVPGASAFVSTFGFAGADASGSANSNGAAATVADGSESAPVTLTDLTAYLTQRTRPTTSGSASRMPLDSRSLCALLRRFLASARTTPAAAAPASSSSSSSAAAATAVANSSVADNVRPLCSLLVAGSGPGGAWSLRGDEPALYLLLKALTLLFRTQPPLRTQLSAAHMQALVELITPPVAAASTSASASAASSSSGGGAGDTDEHGQRVASVRVRREAVHTLLQACAHRDTVALAVSERAVPPLLQVFRNGDDPLAQTAAAGTLHAICYHTEGQYEFMSVGGRAALEHIIDLLASGSADVSASTSGSTVLHAEDDVKVPSPRGPDDPIAATTASGTAAATAAAARVVSAVKRSAGAAASYRLRWRAAGVLHNLSALPSAIRAIRETTRALPVLVSLLATVPSTHRHAPALTPQQLAQQYGLCASVAGTLQNLSREPAARLQLQALGAADRLLPFVYCDDVPCQAAAAAALLNLLAPELGDAPLSIADAAAARAQGRAAGATASASAAGAKRAPAPDAPRKALFKKLLTDAIVYGVLQSVFPSDTPFVPAAAPAPEVRQPAPRTDPGDDGAAEYVDDEFDAAADDEDDVGAVALADVSGDLSAAADAGSAAGHNFVS